ncbi:MAG: pilin [Candidatus Paceibacterota bacterium]|jgi:hypothetical protein
MRFDAENKRKILKFFLVPLLFALMVQCPVDVLAACNSTCGPNDIVCNPLCYDTLEDLVNALINILFVVALVVVPLMFVWAGMLFVTANGEPAKLAKAKNIMLYTVIGLGIILLSRAIVWAVRNVLGVSP